MALGYTALGQNDAALQWIEKAAEFRDVNLPLHLQLSPFDVIRNNPTFTRVRRLMNL